MDRQELEDRTMQFALRIIRLCRALPRSREGRVLGDQLLRAGTSVGANYRASGRGRSKAEFASKLGTVEEEADETCFWLELIIKAELMPRRRVEPLLQEADELTAIFAASVKTARPRRK